MRDARKAKRNALSALISLKKKVGGDTCIEQDPEAGMKFSNVKLQCAWYQGDHADVKRFKSLG